MPTETSPERGGHSANHDVAEAEANYFALLMLMPRGAFETAMTDVRDSFDEKGLRRVANVFQVSVPMVLARSRL